MDYNKLLEKARKVYAECITGAEKRRLESLFPELAESKDGRIRREMIDFLQETIDNFGESPNEWTMYNAKKWVAWLEKQGKQNNIVEQLTAFAQHLNIRGAFRDDLFMDFEHEAQSFIEMQNNKEL